MKLRRVGCPIPLFDIFIRGKLWRDKKINFTILLFFFRAHRYFMLSFACPPIYWDYPKFDE